MKYTILALVLLFPSLSQAEGERVKYAIRDNAVTAFEAAYGTTFSAGRGNTNAVLGAYSIYQTTNAPIFTYMCGDMTTGQLARVTNFTAAGVAGMVESFNNPSGRLFMDINNNPVYFESLGLVAVDPEE